jgi:hypothetical protein
VPPGSTGANKQNGTLLIFSTSDHKGTTGQRNQLPLWSLLAKHSTNHGFSWSDPIQVAPPSAGHYLPASPQSVYDTNTQSIILQFGNNSMKSMYMNSSDGEGGIRSLRSTDCGKSWFGYVSNFRSYPSAMPQLRQGSQEALVTLTLCCIYHSSTLLLSLLNLLAAVCLARPLAQRVAPVA